MMKESPLGAMKATKMKEKESTTTATDAVMKFAFVEPRLSLCIPLSETVPILSNARASGGAITKWHISEVG